jgi:N-acetylneuraminic acid mutarotase
MPVAVSEAMSAVVNGKIYVIGGRTDLATNVVQEYNPVANTWALKTNMPGSRYAAAAIAYNNLIYIVGGAGTGTELDELLIYDPAANSWTAGSQMSEARHGQSGAEVNSQLLVYGGYNTTSSNSVGGYLGILESYDPVQDTWTTKVSGMPRTEVGVAVDNGLMYAFGGNNASNPTLDSSAMYDSATDTWTNKTAMPVAIDFARAATVNGKIYVFGTTDTLEYTPANDGL